MQTRWSRRLRTALGLVLWAACLAPPAAAQNAASLRGTVTDASGGAVAGATVLLTNEATTVARQTTTDVRGGYYFAAVDPGLYALKVEAPGFRPREMRGIRISPNDTSAIDSTLEVATMAESIEVTAERATIETATGAREGLITSDQIDSLSMIGRNPMELLRVLPGMVTPDQAGMETAGKYAGALRTWDYTVNGLRGQNIMITLDGAKLQDVGANAGAMIVPNNEMVDEVKIQTSNYAAEFGSSAVSVRAVTKSGGSAFHGSVYGFMRDSAWAANDRSRSYAGQEKPDTQFQYPGFTVSGPIVVPGTSLNDKRDKLFFFFGAEWSRQERDVGSFLTVTPTAGQRNGHFGDYLGGQHLNQPETVLIPSGFPGAGSPAPNNDLSPYIDPVGRALINLYPLPNYSDPNNRYNYIFSRLSKADRNQQVLRVDWAATDRTRAYVRLARDKDVNTGYRGLWWNSSDVELPSPLDSPSLGLSAVGNVTSILTPSMTNELVLSWSDLRNDNRFEDPAVMSRSTYGIPNLNPWGESSPFVPQLFMQNTGGSLATMNDTENVLAYNGYMSVADTLTKILGSHALKGGFLVERQYKRQRGVNNANVQFNFNKDNNPGSTGSNFGDLLVGRPAQASFGSAPPEGEFVAWTTEAFVQDSWRIDRRLTVEVGLRVGLWTNNAETNDLGAIFLPERYDPTRGPFLDDGKTRVNGLAYVATGDVSRGLTDRRPLLFMPRVNFAWDLAGDGQTVVRGGAGLFHNREQGNAQYNVMNFAPYAYAATIGSRDLAQGLNYESIRGIAPLSLVSSRFNITSVSPESLDYPRSLTTSLSISRRISLAHVVEAGYVGGFGRHLSQLQQQNVVPAGTFSSGVIGNADLSVPVNRVALDNTVIRSRRPYPTLDNVAYYVNEGTSDYHALQATLRRDTGRFRYLASYTFSHAEGTNVGDQGTIDPLDPENRSFGTLPGDRPHLASLSWTLDLGSPVTSGRLGKILANGWHLSGISSYQSGAPYARTNNPNPFTFTGDIADSNVARGWWGTSDYAYALAPVFTCDPRQGGSDVGDRVFDINCVRIPSFGQTGEIISPYTFRTPGQQNHDLTVFKNVALGGDRKLQLRVGAFNVFNQAFPGLGDIDTNLQTTCQGRVNGVPDGAGGTVNGVCDPTRGFTFTQNTLENFGKIVTKRGHRVIELAVKLYF